MIEPKSRVLVVISDEQIEVEILASLANRDPASSVCPSEIARALAPLNDGEWRLLMPRIRNVVAALARNDRVLATRGPITLNPRDLEGGPIRVRRGKRFK